MANNELTNGDYASDQENENMQGNLITYYLSY